MVAGREGQALVDFGSDQTSSDGIDESCFFSFHRLLSRQKTYTLDPTSSLPMSSLKRTLLSLPASFFFSLLSRPHRSRFSTIFFINLYVKDYTEKRTKRIRKEMEASGW